jgi:hypothetical protein
MQAFGARGGLPRPVEHLCHRYETPDHAYTTENYLFVLDDLTVLIAARHLAI